MPSAHALASTPDPVPASTPAPALVDAPASTPDAAAVGVPVELVVEADGGSRGNPGPAGYGAVVVDARTGELLVERSGFLGVATNNVAEYSGLLAGLRAARALNPAARVLVRMDSKLVVEQMSGRWQIKHPALRPLAAEARRVLQGGQVSYEWMPRSQNKRADRLANKAMDAGQRGEAPIEDMLGTTPAGEAAVRGEGDDAEVAAGAVDGVQVDDRVGVQGTFADDLAVTEGTFADDRAGAQGTPADDRAGAQETLAPAPRTTVHLTGPSGTRASSSGPRPTTPDTRAARNLAAPDMRTPATLVLLRHGETPLTPQKRFSGSGGSDPGLSDAGREQAVRVAEALARRGTIEAIVTSPLARTRETAEAVAVRLGLDVVGEDGLRETDFGAWEGLTFGEVRERYPADMNAWLGDPEARPTGGGESFAEVAERVAETRDRLTATYAGRTVLVVSHVTPIKTLIRLALGAPPEALFRMDLSAASLSAVAYYADGNASVRLVNETSHLR